MLGPSVHETLCVPSKSAVSVLPTLWTFCTPSLLAFTAKCSGGSSTNARPSEGLQGPYFVGMSLCRLREFNIFWCKGCF